MINKETLAINFFQNLVAKIVPGALIHSHKHI